MSEFGPSYEKYNRPEDEEAEAVHDGVSEEVETAITEFNRIKNSLSPEIKAKFDEVIPKIDSYYDPEDEAWIDVLQSLDSLIADFQESMSDEEALAELEIECKQELDELVTAVKNLSKKHIH